MTKAEREVARLDQIRLYELMRDDPRLQRGEADRERRVPEELLIARLMPDGPPHAMYDLGVGCFSEWRTLKICWPSMRLFGCEPCLEAYNELLPHFDGKLHLAAVGREDGFADLFISAAAQGGSSLKAVGMEGRPKERVFVMSLDKFDEVCGKPDRVLLWMDIEGSELDAIEGGHSLISSGRVRWINVETRDEDSREGHPTTAQVTAALARHGFRPIHRYNVQGRHPDAAGDVIYFREGIEPLLPCNGGVHVH